MWCSRQERSDRDPRSSAGRTTRCPPTRRSMAFGWQCQLPFPNWGTWHRCRPGLPVATQPPALPPGKQPRRHMRWLRRQAAGDGSECASANSATSTPTKTSSARLRAAQHAKPSAPGSRLQPPWQPRRPTRRAPIDLGNPRTRGKGIRAPTGCATKRRHKSPSQPWRRARTATPPGSLAKRLPPGDDIPTIGDQGDLPFGRHNVACNSACGVGPPTIVPATTRTT